MKTLIKDLMSYVGILAGIGGTVYYFVLIASDARRILDRYLIHAIPAKVLLKAIFPNLPLFALCILLVAILLSRLQKRK